jgi:hypothetical protein
VVRRSDEIITAESLEIVRFLLSYDSSQARIRLKPGTIELTNYVDATALLLITIYLMPIKTEYSESGYFVTKMHPITEYFHEEIVKRIIGREVSNIIAVHRYLLPRCLRAHSLAVLSRVVPLLPSSASMIPPYKLSTDRFC